MTPRRERSTSPCRQTRKHSPPMETPWMPLPKRFCPEERGHQPLVSSRRRWSLSQKPEDTPTSKDQSSASACRARACAASRPIPPIGSRGENRFEAVQFLVNCKSFQMCGSVSGSPVIRAVCVNRVFHDVPQAVEGSIVLQAPSEHCQVRALECPTSCAAGNQMPTAQRRPRPRGDKVVRLLSFSVSAVTPRSITEVASGTVDVATLGCKASA